jgi:K+-sensing histidine kinase KdpD
VPANENARSDASNDLSGDVTSKTATTAGTGADVRAVLERFASSASLPAAESAAQQKSMPAKVVSSRVGRYALAVAAVAVALGCGLVLDRYKVSGQESSLLLFAIVLTAWYLGVGPAAAAVVLSVLAYDYFFSEPRYSFDLQPTDLIAIVVFLLFAIVLTGFSLVRRRTERELIDSRNQLGKRSAELEAINKELEAFAYSISHDLRAPLRHVAGFAELLQKNAGAALDEKSRRYTATIIESAKRMGNLIDDLLAFSRIGRVEARTSTVRLQQLVEEVVDELRQQTGRRNISWNVGVFPEIHGDRSMLRLVLVNLISNAIKFTRPRARAEIEIGAVNDDPLRTVVFVKDNGVGFDMQYANKLFGVFQRLHRTDAFEGTGIGLATVQRIVHRHGGTVWGEGSVDRGATFFFSLPRA